ncbi:hypothetical protein HAZT_HAZT007880 [Hyalella azteca]|uniref:Aminopeptidase n=1 Tax=Hyalella azteca TaxID=294128 RepID=A0A6A0H6X8_HYAAZ|nr:hypothetical protein HAZT_HAZT007880 [Hyalella azteca]
MATGIKSPTRVIKLHAVGLSIPSASVTYDETKEVVNSVSVDCDDASQTMSINFVEELVVGDGTLSLQAYTAPLDTQMHGLYRSKYLGEDGNVRWMAVTQFEAVSARRCFPCWDEPELKATFSLTLTVPKGKTALSNMPEDNRKDSQENSSLDVITFQKSPIMSTYLVAIVVGEYEVLENVLDCGVKVRVFTPLGKKAQGEFALDVASRVLPYYTDYFKVPYPLPKLDLITVPDFSAGAMENWGLITCRESLMLCDPINSSSLNKQRVVIYIAHEVAHQWFGNLVTMQWWTHLWLNEGYANFSQTLCADHLFPEYDIWTQFLSQAFIPALELDSLDSTHPVEVDVQSADSVDEIFDEISYDKGASVIRMLHRYLGNENFQIGMNLYLTRHQYSNTCTEDLWKALADASGKPVEKVMSPWTRQSGFPMVSVEAQTEADSITLHVSQTRFFLNGSKDSSNALWAVPIDVACSMDDKIRCILLDKSSATLELPAMSPNDWIKINAGACGFYRTKYSSDLLKRLVPQLSNQTLPTLDRINILDDLLAMVQAGHTSTVELLEVLKAYKGEEDYSVFMSIKNCTSTLSSVLSHRKELKSLMAPFIRDLFANIHQKLGWEPNESESYLDKLLRPMVLSTLGENGEQSVIQKCQSLLVDHVSGSKMLPADLRACVYKTCMIHGDASTLNTLMKLHRDADSQEERDRLSRCMGATSQLDLLTSVLEFTLEEIRPQDIPFVLYSAAGYSAEGSAFVWEYFKTNYHSKFVPLYADSDLMIRLIKFVSGNFASDDKAEDIRSFFAALQFPPGWRGAQQNIENIRLNAAWLERDADAVSQYLKQWQ